MINPMITTRRPYQYSGKTADPIAVHTALEYESARQSSEQLLEAVTRYRRIHEGWRG